MKNPDPSNVICEVHGIPMTAGLCSDCEEIREYIPGESPLEDLFDEH